MGILTRLLQGAVAGLLATAPMSAVMLSWHRKLPWWQQGPLPPDRLTTRVLDSIGLKKLDEKGHQPLTWISHFGYGAASGSFYPIMGRLPLSPLVKGMLYGLIVWTGSYLGWIPAAGLLEPATEHPKQRNLLMIVAHLVWGATTAALFDLWNREPRSEVV